MTPQEEQKAQALCKSREEHHEQGLRAEQDRRQAAVSNGITQSMALAALSASSPPSCDPAPSTSPSCDFSSF